jgi:GntR family transcriptional regulator
MPNRPLDRSSFAPLYHQLADKLRLMIDQQFAPGDMLPSESELITRYNVSRNTVRQAVEILAQQGFVITRQGKGTFVASERNRYRLQQLVSFSEDMRRRGLQPDTRLLGLARVAPPANILTQLQLNDGDFVHEIRRLRLADGEPMALSTAYIPCELFADLSGEVLASGSLYTLIATRLPFKLSYADRLIKPVVADADQADLLQVAHGSPLMLVEGPAFLENDQPVEYVITYYRGDRYEFSFHAVR